MPITEGGGVSTLDPRRDTITTGLIALGRECPGWNFAVGRVLPGWEAEAVHPASGCRVKVNASGPVTALAMCEAAVKAVRL